MATLAVQANHWTPLMERQSVIFIARWRQEVPVVHHRIYECPSGQPGSSLAFLTALCSPLINTAAYLVTPRQVAVRVTAAPTGAQPTSASFTPERRRVTDRPLKFSHRQWARKLGDCRRVRHARGTLSFPVSPSFYVDLDATLSYEL